MLTATLGFRLEAETGSRFRFAVGAPAGAAVGSGQEAPAPATRGLGTRLDLLAPPRGERRRISPGTVHHVAWRVAGDREQQAWHRDLIAGGHHVSPIMDQIGRAHR